MYVIYICMCIYPYVYICIHYIYLLHILWILTYVKHFLKCSQSSMYHSMYSELYFLFIFCSLFYLWHTDFMFHLIWHSFGKYWTMGKWLDFFPIKCLEILITVSAGSFMCWNSSRIFLASSAWSDSMELKFF